jgi:hypothetical protein
MTKVLAGLQATIQSLSDKIDKDVK